MCQAFLFNASNLSVPFENKKRRISSAGNEDGGSELFLFSKKFSKEKRIQNLRIIMFLNFLKEQFQKKKTKNETFIF